MAYNSISKANGNWSNPGTWATTVSPASGDSYYNATSQVIPPSYTQIAGNWSASSALGTCTLDAVALQVASISAGQLFGTVVVMLGSITAGVTSVLQSVTINATDLNYGGNGWYVFKFGSTYTTSGGCGYAVGVSSSVSNQVNLYRGATVSTWNQLWRTTVTGVPVATSNILIAGEMTGQGTHNIFTVTGDNNTGSTFFGDLNIGDYASLLVLTGANTSTSLSGNLNVWGGGLFAVGSSTGSNFVASAHTTNITFGCSANNIFGLLIKSGGSATLYGSQPQFVKTKLSQTCNKTNILATADNTGWLVGDHICIAGTTASSQSEDFVISAISTTSITAASNLTFFHSGQYVTPFDIRADLGKLNRNVVLSSSVSSNAFQLVQSGSAYCYLNSVEGYSLGTVTFNTIGNIPNSTTDIRYCSFHDSIVNLQNRLGGFSSSADFAFTYNILYNHNWSDFASLGNLLIDNNFWLHTLGTQGTVLIQYAGHTITNNIISDSQSEFACEIQSPAVFTAPIVQFSNNSFYMNPVFAIYITASVNTPVNFMTISGCKFYMNIATIGQSFGLSIFQSICGLTLQSCTSFQNNYCDIGVSNGNQGTMILSDFTINNCLFSGSANNGGVAMLPGTTVPTTPVFISGNNFQPTAYFKGRIINSNIGVNGSYAGNLNTGTLNIQNFNTTMIGTVNTALFGRTDGWFISNDQGLTGAPHQFSYVKYGLIGQSIAAASAGYSFCTSFTPSIITNTYQQLMLWKYFVPVQQNTQRVVTLAMKQDTFFNGTAYASIYYCGQNVTGQQQLSLTNSWANYTLTAPANLITDNQGAEIWIELCGTTGSAYLQTVSWS